ncbi:sulfatase-like hydrolase/transferase [Ochrovirga pacifica]|uniref:sulfatase-like hydrolase/transferase n=1 Tax=Ochrovirga pacifica TaxID=1042376 RepID=UPI000255A54C|nr:sulfatase-like hydrolase/transferase [Ochrovirga pacifica]
MRKYKLLMISLVLTLQSQATVKPKSEKTNKSKPNVIFFAVDDMNDFINPLGYNQAKTPNMDRLAKKGVLFTNAHSPAPYCAPSRTAIWTGLQATTTGCYRDEVYFYDYPDLVSMNQAFQKGGYKTFGAGKLFHHRAGFIDMKGWDKYYARNNEIVDVGYETGYHGDDLPLPKPYPYSPYYRKTNKKITGGKFLEWGPIEGKDVDKMMGVKRTKWICKMLQKKHKDPFFMALGLYTPHFPNYAPKKFFDMYDLDKIVVPDLGKNDLEDLPQGVKRRMTNRSKIQKTLEDIGAVKEAVRAYLAAVSYADELLGEVLDALEQSRYKNNTIVMLWSDQGYHLGEKGNWGKHTLWSETSRVPFIVSGPSIPKNKKVKNTVGLIDIYPTFVDLCNLPKQHKLDGESLVPLMLSSTKKDRDLFIPSHERGNYSVVNQNYRYIYYKKDGGEEFYNIKEDPNEWYNLASKEEYRPIINKMKQAVPKHFRKSATPKRSLKLIFEGTSYHWESKKGGKPQMNL